MPRASFLNRRTAAPIAVVTMVTAVVACSSDDASTSNARPDGRPVPNTTPAQAGGVCGPLDNPCSPGYRGGWAANAQDCYYENLSDGRWDKGTDEHGCAQWFIGGGTGMCCGCPIPKPDASTDASDASNDGD